MPKNTKPNALSLSALEESSLADRIGELNALKKEVEEELEEKKEKFKLLGKQAIQGKKFAVNLLKSFRSSLDRKALEDAIGVETVNKYVKESEYAQVRVSPL